jgi:hypothetical protein
MLMSRVRAIRIKFITLVGSVVITAVAAVSGFEVAVADGGGVPDVVVADGGHGWIGGTGP